MLSVINLRLNQVDNASHRNLPIFSYCTAPAFTLPHLHLPPLLGVTPFEFCPDFRHQKTRVPGLSCGVVFVIPHLAVSVENRLVTDIDTWWQLMPMLASIVWVIKYKDYVDNVHKVQQTMAWLLWRTASYLYLHGCIITELAENRQCYAVDSKLYLDFGTIWFYFSARPTAVNYWQSHHWPISTGSRLMAATRQCK